MKHQLLALALTGLTCITAIQEAQAARNCPARADVRVVVESRVIQIGGGRFSTRCAIHNIGDFISSGYSSYVYGTSLSCSTASNPNTQQSQAQTYANSMKAQVTSAKNSYCPRTTINWLR